LAAALADYNARREAVDQQILIVKKRLGQHGIRQSMAMERLKLALWCEKAGLAAEATAEFTAAVNIDAHCEEAWKHLGYVRHDGRWMPPSKRPPRGPKRKPRSRPMAGGSHSSGSGKSGSRRRSSSTRPKPSSAR
jgi:hypothetical protein